MPRYIEESEAFMVLSDYYHHRTQDQHQALQDAFSRVPTADVVEVVRCKDCKHWHREIHNGIEYFNYSSCDLNHYGDGHNFYCADGERKDGGAE